MPVEPRLILQVPAGRAVSRQLSADPPPSVASGEVVVEHGTADAQGNLEAPDSGQVVLSVPSRGAPTRARRDPPRNRPGRHRPRAPGPGDRGRRGTARDRARHGPGRSPARAAPGDPARHPRRLPAVGPGFHAGPVRGFAAVGGE